MTNQEKDIEKEIRDTYERIGELFGKSLGEGFKTGEKEASDSLEDWGKNLLESQAFYYAEKQRLEQEMEAAEEAKYRREYYNRLQKAKTQSQADVYIQNENLRLQKKANQAYLEELEAHLDAVKAQVEEQKNVITSEFDSISKSATNSLKELSDAKEKMAEKIKDYGAILENRKVTLLNLGPGGSKMIYNDAILDLREERKELEEYAEMLKTFRSMEEIPAELYRAITELSVSDALRYRDEYFRLSDSKRKEYIDDYMAILGLSEEVSQNAYAQETKEVLMAVEEELKTWFGTLPEGFFAEGEVSAEAFGTGFINKIKNLKATLKNAVLDLFREGGLAQKSEGTDGLSDKVAGDSNYSVTYVLNSAGETVAQQLKTADQHATVAKLRGVTGWN